MIFESWEQAVDGLLRENWCISVVDAGISNEELRLAWQDGEEPEAYVSWFAEKYDLIRFEQSPRGVSGGLQ